MNHQQMNCLFAVKRGSERLRNRCLQPVVHLMKGCKNNMQQKLLALYLAWEFQKKTTGKLADALFKAFLTQTETWLKDINMSLHTLTFVCVYLRRFKHVNLWGESCGIEMKKADTDVWISLNVQKFSTSNIVESNIWYVKPTLCFLGIVFHLHLKRLTHLDGCA